MPKSDGSRMKMGPAAWSTLMFAPAALVTFLAAALFLSRIITWEGVGYFSFVTVLLALAPSLHYWRSLDEPSREAHKFAMFWGMGIALMVVIVIGFGLIYFRGPRDLVQGWVEGWIATSKGIFGKQQGAIGFAFGIMTSVVLLSLGYALAWVGWWARQRIGTRAD